jgi:hypothetical protein
MYTAYSLWQRRKRSIELDLGSESGREQAHHLVASADVLVKPVDRAGRPRSGFMATPRGLILPSSICPSQLSVSMGHIEILGLMPELLMPRAAVCGIRSDGTRSVRTTGR